MPRERRAALGDVGFGDMDKLDTRAMYGAHVRRATAELGDAGLRVAIGGEFDAFGVIERELLRFYGLAPDQYLIDVGCGSGRLTHQLAPFFRGRYLGTDLVPDLLEHAAVGAAGHDAWRFELVDAVRIPEHDDAADMVCFFSVLTHVLHEHAYLYLAEAKRVLKPGGRIVFSFLEFGVPAHWAVFAKTVADEREGRPHPINMFIDRAAIRAWATDLGLAVVDVRAGSDRFVPLPAPVTLDSGDVVSERASLGQSIAVLAKPAP